MASTTGPMYRPGDVVEVLLAWMRDKVYRTRCREVCARVYRVGHVAVREASRGCVAEQL